MPLDRFEQEGQPLEVKVAWWPDTLWFIAGEADVETLAKAGVSRGRIWMAKELMDLLAIPGLTAARVRNVATAKAIFQGTVTEGRP